MFTESQIVAATAKSGVASPCDECRTPEPVDLRRILQIAITLHPFGIRKWLQRACEASPRTVDYWLKGQYLPSGAAALKLVRAIRADLAKFDSELKQYEFKF